MKMAPSIGITAKEIFQRWRDLPQSPHSKHLVVGKIAGEGMFSWRDGKIVREFVEYNRRGNLATCREATNAEIESIHEAIERGWFQIEARTASGCMGVYPVEISVVKVYHQATGRPPGVLPIQPVEQAKRKPRKRRPETTFIGDRVVLTDPATGRVIGS
jgi:hypothetical protein